MLQVHKYNVSILRETAMRLIDLFENSKYPGIKLPITLQAGDDLTPVGDPTGPSGYKHNGEFPATDAVWDIIDKNFEYVGDKHPLYKPTVDFFWSEDRDDALLIAYLDNTAGNGEIVEFQNRLLYVDGDSGDNYISKENIKPLSIVQKLKQVQDFYSQVTHRQPTTVQ